MYRKLRRALCLWMGRPVVWIGRCRLLLDPDTRGAALDLVLQGHWYAADEDFEEMKSEVLKKLGEMLDGMGFDLGVEEAEPCTD